MTVLTGAGISGIANYSLKAGGVFYRVYISPVKRRSIVLGHILDAEVLVFIETTILFILSFLLGVRTASGAAGLALALLLLFLRFFLWPGFPTPPASSSGTRILSLQRSIRCCCRCFSSARR